MRSQVRCDPPATSTANGILMSYQFDTLTLHAGQIPDPQYGARAQPIYLTTSFVFKDADQAAALFNMERGGYVYSRIANPTNAVLEERMAAIR